MKARLKVLSGGSAGKELKLKKGQFLIGRSDSCHLRPRSDAVSRKHCVLFIEDDKIRVRDLKSRNGTLVNGEKTAGDVVVKSGDKIVVGPLEFQLLFTTEAETAAPVAPKSPAQQPVAAQQKQAAPQEKAKAKAVAKAAGGNAADDDIFGWLEEADEVDREERLTDPSTRQFKVGEKPSEEEGATDTIDMAKADGKGSDTSVGKNKKPEKKEKKEPGKLPPVPTNAAEDSQAAAADALKQFFKRS